MILAVKYDFSECGIGYTVQLMLYLKSAQTCFIYRHEGSFSLWWPNLVGWVFSKNKVRSVWMLGQQIFALNVWAISLSQPVLRSHFPSGTAFLTPGPVPSTNRVSIVRTQYLQVNGKMAASIVSLIRWKQHQMLHGPRGWPPVATHFLIRRHFQTSHRGLHLFSPNSYVGRVNRLCGHVAPVIALAQRQNPWWRHPGAY